jgi:hypothetical protein
MISDMLRLKRGPGREEASWRKTLKAQVAATVGQNFSISEGTNRYQI